MELEEEIRQQLDKLCQELDYFEECQELLLLLLELLEERLEEHLLSIGESL